MPLPKVSVVLPAYNAEAYLHSAIQSILNQSYQNFEFIIINDGSTDSTEKIISSFDDHRIIYIKNPKNLGLINSLNYGFEQASGQFIARMDSDDIAHPDRLKIQVDFLLQLNKPAIVGSNMVLINSENEIIKVPRRMNLSAEENNWVKMRKCPIHHPTVMVSKEIVEANKPFYLFEEKYAEDHGAWLRIGQEYPIYNIDSYLLFYRIHGNNVSAIHHSEQIIKTIELITNSMTSLKLAPISNDSIHQLLLLKTWKRASFETLTREFSEFGKNYIELYGHKNLVLQDTAYALLSIAIKSHLIIVRALFLLTRKLGLKNIIKAFMKIGLEFFNSVALKMYYQLTFPGLLKNLQKDMKIAHQTPSTQVSIPANMHSASRKM